MIRTSWMPPSIICMPKELSRSSMDSQNPTTYMAQATALASEKINPIEPPNSGPSDLDIMKYVPPPGLKSKIGNSKTFLRQYFTFDDSVRADGAHTQRCYGGDNCCGRYQD